MSTGKWTAPEYLRAKPKIRILVLGSYDDSAVTNLEGIKEFLIAKGYGNTRLVRDFRNPLRGESEPTSDYNLRKSEYWLPMADIAVFVFLPNVDNDGVEYELKHTVDIYSDMMWRSIIAWSSNPPPKVTSLIEGLVNRWQESTNLVFFGTFEKLCDEIFGVLTGILERMYYNVISRSDGEWEMDSQI